MTSLFNGMDPHVAMIEFNWDEDGPTRKMVVLYLWRTPLGGHYVAENPKYVQDEMLGKAGRCESVTGTAIGEYPEYGTVFYQSGKPVMTDINYSVIYRTSAKRDTP